MRPGGALLPATSAAIGLHSSNQHSFEAREASYSLWILGPSVIVLDPLGSFFFGTSAYLTYYDNAFGLRIRFKGDQAFYQIRTSYDIATHANAQTLAQASTGDRCDCLVA